MHEALLPDGYNLIHLDVIDSTNAEARRRIIDSQAHDKDVITAGAQQAGRGRYDRVWESTPDGFYLSIIRCLDKGSDALSSMSLVVALALREALNVYVKNAASLDWKWPNDILLDHKKVAGILLESVAHQNKQWVVIGVGVNLTSSPSETSWPATHLNHHTKTTVSMPDLRKTFVKYFESYYKRYTMHGFETIRDECLKYAVNLGQMIEVRLMNETLFGRFDGLDNHGNLLLTIGQQQHQITAGDVFFLKHDATNN